MAKTIVHLVPKIAMQAVSHGMFQGTMTGVQGGNFWQGFASGAAASVASSFWSGGKMANGGYWGGIGGKFAQSGAGQITFGTISGGAGAALTGGNFWEGAAIGFVVSAANHTLHGDPIDPKKKKAGAETSRDIRKYLYGNSEQSALEDFLFGPSYVQGGGGAMELLALGPVKGANWLLKLFDAKSSTTAFKSFSAFKRALGPAGPGKAWHHIVEQGGSNVSKFGANRIHNTSNLIKLPHGKGTIHSKISGFYSSKQPFTGGQTVRQWLSTQSYQQQYDFGIKTLKQFGWTP